MTTKPPGRRLAQGSVFPILAALTSMAHADDIHPLSEAALAKAIAAPEVQQARQLMRDPKHDADVVALFAKAAQKGNPVAQTYLGYLNYVGNGVQQNDQAAATWYKQAAEQGFLDAELRLGAIYKLGRNLYDPNRTVIQDNQTAMHWLQIAANQGSAEALTQIGEIYFLDGSKEGFQTGRDFFRRAAAKGDAWGMSLLCFTYHFADSGSSEQTAACQMAQQHPYQSRFSNETDAILNSDQIPAASY